MFNAKKKYAVIGLGTFGYTVATSLSHQGLYVIAVDRDLDKVEKIRDEVSESVSFDANEADLLRKLGIIETDVAIISIGGDDFQAAEFIALELHESGVQQIYVTVESEREERIIQTIGVADVINPQMQAARNLADEILAVNTKK